MKYPWPGNIRELEHSIERASLLCKGDFVTMKDIPAEVIEALQGKLKAGPMPMTDEPEQIAVALAKTGGNKAKAARLLGISRKTLYRKLEKYELAPQVTGNQQSET